MTDTLVDDLIAAPPVADVAVVPYHQNSTYVLLVVEPKHGERVEYRISVGAADVLFHELAGMSGLEVVETDPSKAFAAWCEQGPKLAKAAGLYVGIKVMPGSGVEGEGHGFGSRAARARVQMSCSVADCQPSSPGPSSHALSA